MRNFRKFLMTALVAPVATVALAGNAMASTATVARPYAPFPECGNHFILSRAGANVHVVGVDLGAFFSGYMLVWPAANGRSFGPYNAAPSYGAGFTFNSGSTSKTTVSISLTDSSNVLTLCSSDYTV